MADKDTVTKEYMQDNEVFADVFNFLLYDGEQVIKPEQLRPLDTTAIALPYGEDNKSAPIQKYRDILKMVTAMQDDKMAYLLLGIENQSQIHYAMPVRNMLYDAIQYVRQVEDTAKSHKNGENKADSKAEFLSGFYHTDKLLPVITVTVYFGADEWNAPKSLHDIIEIDDKGLLKFIPDYKMNLIAPYNIDDWEFSKFHTELSLAMKYIKYSKSKKRLKELVHEDEAYRNVSRRTADMVNIVTGSDLSYKMGEERVDMCKAIEDMRKDALAEGVIKGLEEGKIRGKEEGKIEGIISTLAGLVKDGILSLADAAQRAGMTVSEFEIKAGLR